MNRRTKNNLQNTRRKMSWRLWCVTVVFGFGCLIFGFILISCSQANNEFEGNPVETSAPIETENEPIVPIGSETENASQDYSRFRHSNLQHARLPCLLCHKRDDNSTTPKMPGHSPCSGCHVEQFAAGNQHPMCYICHTATSVKRFPPLRSFNARFDHAQHIRQTNCTTCHKPTRRGVAFSIPQRANAHASCFQCHGPNTRIGDRNIGSCGTCHQPGRPPAPVSENARAFQVNFSHAEHGARNMNCATCHTVRAGLARGRQVSSPTAAMHFAPARAQSCATCHNNKRAFGGDDFSDCKRCHTGSSFGF